MEVTHVTAAMPGSSRSRSTEPIGSVDAYEPVIENNVRADIATFTVGASGMRTLRVRTIPRTPRPTALPGYLVWLRLVKQ